MGEQQPDPDAALVAAWQDGTITRDMVEGLADRVLKWICRWDKGLLGEADDLTAITLGRVNRKIHTFQFEAKFFTWVIGYAKNVLREHYRKRSQAAPRQLDEEEVLELPAPDDPERQALLRMAIEEARDQALEPREREVFILRWEQQLSAKEVAERLQISDNNAQLIGKKAAAKVCAYLKKHDWL